MTKIICISGKAQNGKDTTANIMKNILQTKNTKVLIMHHSDLLKFICQKYFGWDGKKDETGRGLLQHVGTNIVRIKQPDYWVDFVINFLKLFENEWDYVLIPDCRFPNEINKYKDAGFNTTHIRVVRENFDDKLTEEQKNHPSETALDEVIPDFYIYNNRTEEALTQAINYLVENKL